MLPYTLGELDKLLPKGKPPSRRLTGIGRNCDLFKSMVSEVFRPRWAAILGAQGWPEAWLDHVRGQNAAMFAPDVLPDSECRSIAKVLLPVLDHPVRETGFLPGMPLFSISTSRDVEFLFNDPIRVNLDSAVKICVFFNGVGWDPWLQV